jgi:hypothetical protein
MFREPVQKSATLLATREAGHRLNHICLRAAKSISKRLDHRLQPSRRRPVSKPFQFILTEQCNGFDLMLGEAGARFFITG